MAATWYTLLVWCLRFLLLCLCALRTPPALRSLADGNRSPESPPPQLSVVPRFLPFFWRVAQSDSFFKKSQLPNSRNLSLIHATLHLIRITLLIFHVILHIFHTTYPLIWYWEKSRLQELWLLLKESEWVGVALLGNRHNPSQWDLVILFTYDCASFGF